MYNDEHLGAKWMELFVYLSHSAECAAESPVTAEGLLKWRLEIQNILTSYLTCADHKQAWTKSTNGYLGLFVSHCAAHSEPMPNTLWIYRSHSHHDWQLGFNHLHGWNAAWTQICSGLWLPRGHLSSLMSHTPCVCLGGWEKQNQSGPRVGWFGTTTLRRC